jgi:hypothetical protein
MAEEKTEVRHHVSTAAADWFARPRIAPDVAARLGLAAIVFFDGLCERLAGRGRRRQYLETSGYRELAEMVGLKKSAAHQSLRKLVDAGLVVTYTGNKGGLLIVLLCDVGGEAPGDHPIILESQKRRAAALERLHAAASAQPDNVSAQPDALSAGPDTAVRRTGHKRSQSDGINLARARARVKNLKREDS